MSRLFPFVSVDGAKDAIELYKKAFDAKVIGEMSTYGEFPNMEAYKDLIAHATLHIFDSPMYIQDAVDQPDLQ